ncbi:MAG: hypothetical protein K8R90_09760 [Candidatus Cloacimonetes bacterium]|nr:hypothetical protein [Candidatus Cloacimonadota bacterium]
MFKWLKEFWINLFGCRASVDDIPDAVPSTEPRRPPPRPPGRYAEAERRLRGSMKSVLNKLRGGELTAIRSAMTELESESVLTIENPRVATIFLEKLWEGDKAFLAAARARSFCKNDTANDGWRIGLCEEFLTQLADTEQSFKGRILQAIRKLSNSPEQAKSRLAEPLGPEEGPWIYSIGNARLLYLIDPTTRYVFLLAYT